METQTITTTTWTIDPMHSEVQFTVKHLMVSTVSGQFGQFEGQLLMTGDDFEGAKITFSADVNSISTGNGERDNHLKSADFFSADQFPQLTFVSTTMTKIDNDTYDLSGNLSIHGVTKPIVLNVVYGGQMQDFYGSTKAGFDITGAINRKDFGLTWDGITEAGGVVVSDQVKLIMNIQVTKQIDVPV